MKNTENKLNKIIGPIKLPLEIDNHVDYHSLYYFEYNNERWACVCYGDLSINKPITFQQIIIPRRKTKTNFFY